ncbi:hypothetical protein [Hymenobacter saemangeumensis]|uniref:hypothetical protein n=1 Tax=Hymenobacter saemangeumensis TaxID=1084522 RepID=UPI0031EF8505
MASATKVSPYKRPYSSRRKRSSQMGSTKSNGNHMLLRLLIALVVVLVATIVFIVKFTGNETVPYNIVQSMQ